MAPITTDAAAPPTTTQSQKSRLVAPAKARHRPSTTSLSLALARGGAPYPQIAAGGLCTSEDFGVIEGDTFYAGGSAEAWDRLAPAEKADRVIDWRRQRAVLEQLHRSGVAQWQSFDWDADDWDSETIPLVPIPTVARAAPVVILEGAYSCRPELHDLLDLRVLLDMPHDLRRQRVIDREGEDYQADWEARWSTAEDYYLGMVMPPERFDLVLVFT
jgi:hypothetical protein